MPIDPFGLLGSAIANVVTDSLTAAMLALFLILLAGAAALGGYLLFRRVRRRI